MKKNKNYKVVLLTISCFLIYLLVSIMFTLSDLHWKPMDNVNLVSEVLYKESITDNTDSHIVVTRENEDTSTVDSTSLVVDDFNLYQEPETITNFKSPATAPALPNFIEKLAALKSTKKGKIRIAYFGDSMIEGDLLTQKLRELLQADFGGEGVGFVTVYSEIHGFRLTANAVGKGWEDTNFINNKDKTMYISGHVFTGEGKTSFKDNTIKKPTLIEKSLIFGQKDEGVIQFNGQSIQLDGSSLVNRKVLAKDSTIQFSLKSKTASLPIYGVSFESENGVFVDNFPFRSVTGTQLSQINTEVLKAIEENNPYDLVVFQYGVNLLFRPKDTNYDYYGEQMTPILHKFQEALPHTEFLIIGSADRAFRYNGTFKTAIGLPNLIKVQAQLAFDNHMAFYNQFESMGGENSIVDWVNQKPSLANKDHVHPNKRGTDLLAEKLYGAILKDYNKYKNQKNN